MADRSRRRNLRRTFRFLLLAGAVALGFRIWGPSIVIIRDRSVAPAAEAGDIVLAAPERNGFHRGDIVLVEPVVASRADDGKPRDRLVIRIVVGLPGDTVTWSDAAVRVRRGGELVYSINPESLLPTTATGTRQSTVRDDYLFLVSPAAGRFDSRVLGPVRSSLARYHLRRVLWPANRRGAISAVPSSP